MLELIIHKENDVEKIVLVENGKIIENYVNDEENKRRRLEGNIYSGQISDIIHGMQAAFVDFGGEKKGFIHLKDLLPQVDETKENINLDIDIKQIVKDKEKVLVQVKKDSDNKKGARVSTHINLPGKYIVLMPKAPFITISQKIENKDVRKKLKEICKNCIPEGFGAIVRTSAENVGEEDIKEDINYLINIWKDIENNYKNSKNIKLLYESENIVDKIIIDLCEKNLEKITTNDKKEYARLTKLTSKMKNKIEIVLEQNKNLMEMYDIEKQIEKTSNRKIWLNCGGFITIDKTEALTAIDVNTGKYTGNKDLESTIFKVNEEATKEIAKQLRLRDIGGIIIIDYIDMKNKEHKQKIEELLKKELKSDRAKTQVEGFTKLNLMEMTRKHICSHLNKE